MARRGENIYKRKDGRWEGRYKNGFKLDGKTKYSSVYGKSYAEVRSALVQKRVQLQTEAPVCRLKFGEIIQIWLKSLKNTVKESTYANYLMKIEKHILSKLGGISYDKLTAETLNDFVAERLESGLSAKYVSDISVLIKSVTKFAHRQYGYADKAEFMSLPKKDKSAPKLLLSNSDQNILTSNLMKNISPSNAGILLSAATGMRIGELCALKWSDFDFEKSIVTVSRTMQRIKNRDGQGTKIIVTSPKSRTSLREIPIPEFLKNVLVKVKTNNDRQYQPTKIDEQVNPLFAESLTKTDYVEYVSEVLTYGSDKEKRQLYASCREDILKIQKRLTEIVAHERSVKRKVI